MKTRTGATEDHKASYADTARVTAKVLAPLLGRGVIVRRPKVVAAEAHIDSDREAVRMLQAMRRKYGGAPLQLRLPKRPIALVLSVDDARRILSETAAPFDVATKEKRGALKHFQPHGLLISQGRDRQVRRNFTESLLDTESEVHKHESSFVTTIEEETERALPRIDALGALRWVDFTRLYWRVARRILLGERARDDHELTDELLKLRKRANWSFFAPTPDDTLESFRKRLRAHIASGEHGSVAGLVAGMPDLGRVDPESQFAHWLFAFDATAIATFRALALLASHPDAYDRAAEDVRSADPMKPFLRAVMLESTRLWPTTPAILREVSAPTDVHDTEYPAHTSFALLATFFCRDDETLPFANHFDPDVWLDGRARANPSLMSFSAGPASCPGRNLVLLVASNVMAAILRRRNVRLLDTPFRQAGEMPGVLNAFDLRFEVRQ